MSRIQHNESDSTSQPTQPSIDPDSSLRRRRPLPHPLTRLPITLVPSLAWFSKHLAPHLGTTPPNTREAFVLHPLKGAEENMVGSLVEIMGEGCHDIGVSASELQLLVGYAHGDGIRLALEDCFGDALAPELKRLLDGDCHADGGEDNGALSCVVEMPELQMLLCAANERKDVALESANREVQEKPPLGELNATARKWEVVHDFGIRIRVNTSGHDEDFATCSDAVEQFGGLRDPFCWWPSNVAS